MSKLNNQTLNNFVKNNFSNKYIKPSIKQNYYINNKSNNPLFKDRKYLSKNSFKQLILQSRKRKTLFKKSFKQPIPYFNIKLKNEINFFMFRLKTLTYSDKFKLLRKYFYFHFLRYIFSLFEIKVILFQTKKVKKTRNKIAIARLKKKRNKEIIKQIQNGKIKIIFMKDNEQKFKFLNIKNKIIINIITEINFALTQYLEKTFVMSAVSCSQNKFYILLYRYYNSLYLKFLSK
jgi:hypothetical protein